jgi:hypothetical protein
MSSRPGDTMDSAPLIHFNVFQLTNGETEIPWTPHHALFDGRDRLILLQEFQKIYKALSESRKPNLDSAPPYSDYLSWCAGKDFSDSHSFWRTMGAKEQPMPPLTCRSSSWVPRSAMRPSSRTRTWSAFRTALSQCATTQPVRPTE